MAHRLVVVAVVLGTLVGAQRANAALYEHRVGVDGAGMLPGFQSADATHFAAFAPGWRVHYAYGIGHRLYGLVRFSNWRHSGGKITGYEYDDPPRGSYVGELHFVGEVYRAGLGLRYALLSGYEVNLLCGADTGYQWTTWRNNRLVEPTSGGSFGVDIADFGRGSWYTTAELTLEYRAFNTVALTASLQGSAVIGEIYRGELGGALGVAYYWF